MNKKCFVCAQRGKTEHCLSFHRFPNDVERKKLWLEALKIESANKWHYVCSQHFQQSDYHRTKTNTKLLKKCAVPSIVNPLDAESRISRYVPSPPILPRELRSSDASHARKELFPAPESIPSNSKYIASKPSNSEDISESFVAIPAPKRPKSSSSTSTASERTLTASEKIITPSETTLTASDESTLTASEGEDDYTDISFKRIDPQKQDNVEPTLKKRRPATSTSSLSTQAGSDHINISVKTSEAAVKKKMIVKRRVFRKSYVGDITSGDLGTPTKAKRAFSLGKTKIVASQKKIGVLQKYARRMKAKVTSLKSLLAFLKDKNFISENTQETIEASLPGPAADMIKRILKGRKVTSILPHYEHLLLHYIFISLAPTIMFATNLINPCPIPQQYLSGTRKLMGLLDLQRNH